MKRLVNLRWLPLILMQVSPKALDYPYFSRVMCGTSETYSLFAFPSEIPTKFYIQVS